MKDNFYIRDFWENENLSNDVDLKSSKSKDQQNPSSQLQNITKCRRALKAHKIAHCKSAINFYYCTVGLYSSVQYCPLFSVCDLKTTSFTFLYINLWFSGITLSINWGIPRKQESQLFIFTTPNSPLNLFLYIIPIYAAEYLQFLELCPHLFLSPSTPCFISDPNSGSHPMLTYKPYLSDSHVY